MAHFFRKHNVKTFKNDVALHRCQLNMWLKCFTFLCFTFFMIHFMISSKTENSAAAVVL